VPGWATAGDRPQQAVDARLYDDVIWTLRRHHLRVTAAREAGHNTRGDGTAIHLVPTDGVTQPVWDASAGQLAHDLGWNPPCGSTESPPARSVPAIQLIGYAGPAHRALAAPAVPRTCTFSWSRPATARVC